MTNFNGVKIRRLHVKPNGVAIIIQEELYELNEWNAAKEDYARGVKALTLGERGYNKIEFRTIMENVMDSYEIKGGPGQ